MKIKKNQRFMYDLKENKEKKSKTKISLFHRFNLSGNISQIRMFEEFEDANII